MKGNVDELLKEVLGRELKTNVVLRDFTSLKVGGVSDYFYVAKSVKDLVKAVAVAVKIGLPYFILGGGNNIVVSDIGFPGLVIKNEARNLAFLPNSAGVVADSGANLGKLLTEAASRDLGGLEFLFGVPGTVGGAVYGNAGAHKSSIGEYVKFVTFLMPNKKTKDFKIVKYRPDWLEFRYRQSRLKKMAAENSLDAAKPIILTVKLQLARSKSEIILDKMRKCLAVKKESQPMDLPSAGSFFKNLGPEKEQSAGFLLDHVGAKKVRVGKAAVSKRHANFIVNKGNARAEDIKRLAEQLKIKVRDEYRVNLEEEVEYVGRW